MYFKHIQGRNRHGRRHPQWLKNGQASPGSESACCAGRRSSSRCSVNRSRKSNQTVLVMQQGSGQKRQVRRRSTAIEVASCSISRRIALAMAIALPRISRCRVNSRFRAQLDVCHCRVGDETPAAGQKRGRGTSWLPLPMAVNTSRMLTGAACRRLVRPVQTSLPLAAASAQP